MSIRRMTLGAGYRYLMSSIARADTDGPANGLTAYYGQHGTPPGRFLGAGLADLDDGRGVTPGSQVSEEQLWRMLGMLQDPATGQPLGRPPVVRREVVDRFGRVRPAPKPVAAFDLTFSAPKSVSVAWAMADPATREIIRQAHQDALETVITHAERQVFATRVGKGGVVQEDVTGIVGAAFEHWDSRAGDPQLHTHVVVLNRAKTVYDGQWRTLDSKALFKATVGLSELYNGVLADLLTARLGWGWKPEQRRRSTEPKWEVTGVNATLRDEFSQRTDAIERVKDVLVDEFAAAHGRQPTGREVLQLRQQATLATRPDKHTKPLAELLAGWRKRAEPHVGTEAAAWAAALSSGNDLPLLHLADLDGGMLSALADATLEKVSAKRPTFTHGNVFAEVLRALHGVRLANPNDRARVAHQVTAMALERAVMLTPPDTGVVPDSLRRADGTSKFRARGSEVYATQDLLDAEDRLLSAGRECTGPAVPTATAKAVAAAPLPDRNVNLSLEQQVAVVSVATSGRALDVLVGPAGTGKSTTMAGVRAVWEAQHGSGSVVGLAPSAAAAEVLADAVGIPTENTAMWLTEQRNQPERRARLENYAAALNRASPTLNTRRTAAAASRLLNEYNRWAVAPGRLVIVDEASMAATRDLDQITHLVTAAGGKLLLVGDWAQLSPVQAGGAFKLLATDRDDTPSLLDVRRFTQDWERAASLAIRNGFTAAADTYVRHGRVEAGTREDMLDLLFDAWSTDIVGGRSSLMLAGDTATVSDLNERARRRRIADGLVDDTHHVRLSDGSQAGVGDFVVTRQNQRSLTTMGARPGWVKNGDAWTVQAIATDGTVTVRLRRGTGSTVLPAEYVAEHLELGYASTAHRAQGRTVDTAHAYLTSAASRETIYVIATRGRDSNRIYIDTADDPDPQTQHQDNDPLAAEEVLVRVLQNISADRSANEVRTTEERSCRSAPRALAEGAAVSARRHDPWNVSEQDRRSAGPQL